MKKYKYMHTMDGEPAYFDGDQLVFCLGRSAITLVPTLAVIYRQRKHAKAWRLKEGFLDTDFSYSHRRVIV